MMIEIQLTKGYVAIIDDEDAHLAEFKWCACVDPTGIVYAIRSARSENGSRQTIRLHRVVLGFGRGDPLVDHRDGNGLNCRRANLRPSTSTVNSRNRREKGNSSSPYSGVYLYKKNGRWLAVIGMHGKIKHLGYFDTQQEALSARLNAEKSLWGIEPQREFRHEVSS